MEKNYYEILEIDKKASDEMIKKAYNTLAKKYHPDLQPDNLKHISEEKLKLINEAYETLSDSEKRKHYDIELSNIENENEFRNKEIIDKLLNENASLKNELNHLKQNYNSNKFNTNIYNEQNNYQNTFQSNANYNAQNNFKGNFDNDFQNNTPNSNYENEYIYQQELEQARQKAYYDAYIQDLKNRGYKIKYKKTPQEHLKNFISMFFTIIILILLWQIPFIKNFFANTPGLNFISNIIEKIFSN